MSPLLNLIDAHFQKSNLFNHLPIFDAIYYRGHPEGKIQSYKAVREDQECTLLALTIIRKEEDFLWDSVEDFMQRNVLDAAARVHGVYTFDLLTFDVHNELKTFNFAELQAMIVVNARKVRPGEQRLIKYSSAYGIMQKMVAEDWGKIVLKTSVEIFKDKPAFLYVLIKRLFKIAGIPNGPLILLVNDISSDPLYNLQDKEQQQSLASLIAEQSRESIEFLPEVYIQDRNGVRELLSGSAVK